MTAKRKPVKKSEKQIIVQKALQVTWVLKGQLKTAQMSYLRIGATLVKVRDDKMFAALGHPDMEDYSEKRLQLGRASLYRYLQVYQWVSESHKEWLQPKPKGFIPDLSDIADLMWIENELKRSDLSQADRNQLENLRKKGLAGQLLQRELEEWKKKGKKIDSIKSYLNKFKSFRTRCARIVGMPPEVIRCLDDAITILKNQKQVASCGFDISDLNQKQNVV